MTRAVRHALWWLLDYAYAARWQLRSIFNRTDAKSFAVGDKAPVVVLPGVYESWKFMQPLIEELHRRGHPVHVVEALRRNRRPVEDAAVRVSAFLRSAGLRDVVLVAHSKGGLAGKLVMVGPEAERVTGMLAVATPFSGSRYARMTPGRTLRAFSPTHPSIREIGRHQVVNARVVSVFGRFDPHIPEGSELVGARNVRLDTGGHFRILAHPQVLVEFSALVERS
jgi:predicted alpha/beta hydrolase family esterase